MKTTRTLLALALLAALLLPGLSTPLHAAKIKAGARAVTNKAVKKNRVASDGPVDVEQKWYLGLAADYITTNGAIMDKFKGGSLILGYRISQNDRVQLELGYNTGSYDGLYNWTMPIRIYGGSKTTANIDGSVRDGVLNPAVSMTGAVTAKVTMMPVLLTYSYCVRPLTSPKLGWFSTERLEMRMTPIIGMFAMKGTWTRQGIPHSDKNNPDKGIIFLIPKSTTLQYKVTYPGYTGTNAVELWPMDPASGSDSVKLAATAGIGAGLTYNLGNRWQLDLDYRYLWVAKAVNSTPAPEWDGLNAENGGAPWPGKPWNSVTAWNGMNVTQITAAIGWKF